MTSHRKPYPRYNGTSRLSPAALATLRHLSATTGLRRLSKLLGSNEITIGNALGGIPILPRTCARLESALRARAAPDDPYAERKDGDGYVGDPYAEEGE